MQEEKRDNQLLKLLVILMAVVFFVLFTVAIIQTFTLKNLDNKLQTLENNNKTTLEQIEDTNKELEIRESEDYVDEYLEKEGYGKDGEVIIKQQ